MDLSPSSLQALVRAQARLRGWRERAAIKRGDRVYSVALDRTGAHLAVGGRDKIAIVYALDERARADGRGGGGGGPAVEMEVAIGSFIYTIDLTPDARRLAVGTVDSCVYVYAVLGSAAGPGASAGKLTATLAEDASSLGLAQSRAKTPQGSAARPVKTYVIIYIY